MDFDLTDSQQALVSSLQSMFAPYGEIPEAGRGLKSYFAADLQAKLVNGGFFAASRDAHRSAARAARPVSSRRA